MRPAISTDGKYVAYMVGEPGSFRIFVRQITGERAVKVSGDLPGDHTDPQWSPDGAQIAFLVRNSVYVVPATGGSPKTLIESDNLVTGVACSPDGSTVAYTHLFGLWLRASTGGPKRRLIEEANLHSAAWS